MLLALIANRAPHHPHITHADSLGNEGRTAVGDVQVMSAGTGIIHSEFNLEDVDTTLFQKVTHELEAGRGMYLVASRGSLEVNGIAVPHRAGATIRDEAVISIKVSEDAEVVAVDLP